MTLFIASEVMFFVAFFWAYFHFALFPIHVSGAAAPPVWPPRGILTFDPWGLPFLNTMILLLSGCTVTWAHAALIKNDRKGLLQGLTLTVLLGISFTSLQAWEYSMAPFPFVDGGIYPSVFFLATGFHGFHVIVGTTFLLVCLIRAYQGPLHAGTPFRLRGSGLVLALRGRGVAVPLHLHLLAGRRRDRPPLTPRRMTAPPEGGRRPGFDDAPLPAGPPCPAGSRFGAWNGACR